MKQTDVNSKSTGSDDGRYRPAYGRENDLAPLSRPQQLDTDVLMTSGIVALIAFLGIAAVGLYAGAVSSGVMERTPIAQSTTGFGN
jgi:hypothetical protein